MKQFKTRKNPTNKVLLSIAFHLLVFNFIWKKKTSEGTKPLELLLPHSRCHLENVTNLLSYRLHTKLSRRSKCMAMSWIKNISWSLLISPLKGREALALREIEWQEEMGFLRLQDNAEPCNGLGPQVPFCPPCCGNQSLLKPWGWKGTCEMWD